MTQTPRTISPQDQAGTPAAVLYARVRWLIGLRWIYAAMLFVPQVLSVLLGKHGLIELRGLLSDPTLWPAYGFVLLNLLWIVRLRPSSSLPGNRYERGTFVQLLLDLIIWIIAAQVTVSAPPGVMPVQVAVLVAAIVFHLAVSASMLSARAGYRLASVAWVLFVIGPGLSLAGFNVLIPIDKLIKGLLVGRGVEGWFESDVTNRLGRVSDNAWAQWMAGSIIVAGVFWGVVFFINALLTRLRRINQRLVEANRRLEGLDLAKSRFLRISAHQLRSPLAAVHTMLSAIQEAGGLNHQQYEIVRKIQTKSEDAMTLVDEMMLLSTISESAAEVRQVHPCDVDAAVRAEVEAFSPVAGAKRLTLCIDAQSGAAVIAWDDALETVLEHLISNAVKYTPSGGSIGIATRRCDAGVELKVTDTGIGIPPEQKDRLFHEFFRATNARQVAGGTGMGLAIVQAIVGRLDGTILIDSTQDKGTAVTVVLPITESPAAQVADGAEDAETPKTSESGADAGEHKGENDDRLEMPMTQGRLKPAK